MKINDLINALRKLSVETGSLACLGCGYEHNCSVHGCAILREAAAMLEKQATREHVEKVWRNVWNENVL